MLPSQGKGVEGIPTPSTEETKIKKQTAATKTIKSKKQIFPPGWNEKRVREVIAFYDKQTEDEELAEYEAAIKLKGLTMMLVPTRFVTAVRQLIGSQRGA